MPESNATGSASIHWVAPTTNEDGSALHGVAGYYIYYGTDQNRLDHRIDIRDPKATTWTVNGLAPGTWYFAVAAVGNGGSVSAYSKIGSKTVR